MLCRCCQTDKPETDFWVRRTQNADGVVVSGRQSKCIDCFKQYRASRDPAHVKSVKARWRSQSHVRAAECAAAVAYRQEHPEAVAKTKQWLSEHKPLLAQRRRETRRNFPEHEKAIAKTRRDRNPEKHREHCRLRRVRISGAENTLTRGQWQSLLAGAHGVCTYCRKAAPLSMDHVIPLSRGGGHTASNVVPACKSCNSSKGNRLLSEWTERAYNVCQSEVSPDAITVTAS